MIKTRMTYTRGPVALEFSISGTDLADALDIATGIRAQCDERFAVTTRDTNSSVDADAQSLLDWIEAEGKAHSRTWLRRKSPLKSATRTDKALDQLLAAETVELRTCSYTANGGAEKLMQGVFLPHWIGGLDINADTSNVLEILTPETALSVGEIAKALDISNARASRSVTALIKEKRARRTEDGKGVYLG